MGETQIHFSSLFSSFINAYEEVYPNSVKARIISVCYWWYATTTKKFNNQAFSR